ncbi:hypothetical protein QBC43DRAFT_209604 [Cladorrhinum sp. PSN259]|nr:hypothetical protein QBC43DRAFT_209604 [Cladorrhinum sp. PSN259]
MSESKAKASVPQAITNSRRILAVSHESSADLLGSLVTSLTGSSPTPSKEKEAAGSSASASASAGASLAGTTHHLPLETRYYSASVPIWLDLISDEPEEWASSFLSEEAKEVLEVLGGIVIVFPVHGHDSRQKGLLEQVGRVVREGLGGWEWGGVSLAIGVGTEGVETEDGVVDDWEDLCAGCGMEFVYWENTKKGEKGKRNEYGERVGIERVLEALESNDWDGGKGYDDDGEEEEEEDEGRDEDEKDFGVGLGKDDDFEALKKAIFSGGDDGGEGGSKGEEEEDEARLDDENIKSLERMMQKLQAVRDMSAGLPEGERKRMAKRAVEEVMKEL